MYAIVETGGKQYKVLQGDIIDIEKISQNTGDVFTFDRVLAIGDKETSFGTPYVENAKVEVEVLEQIKADKVKVFKMKKRKSYRRKQGHRQKYTRVQVKSISK